MNEQQILAQASNFFTNTWEKIITFFTSYQWQEIVFIIRIIFIMISFILLLLIVVLLIKIIVISPLERSLFKSKSDKPVFSKRKIEKRMDKINKKLKSGPEANYKLAVLEAEKLFDRVLKEIGYGAEKKLANITEIKEANKIKNNIIEDKKSELSKEKAEETVDVYKRGLEELLR